MLLSGTLWVHGIPRLGALVGGRTPDRCETSKADGDPCNGRDSALKKKWSRPY